MSKYALLTSDMMILVLLELGSKTKLSVFSMEFAYLRDKTAATLAKYYDSKNHVKRQLQAGGISDLRRDLQARIHINIGPDIDNYTGDVSFSYLNFSIKT